MIEIYAASTLKELNSLGKIAIQEDLEKRFQKAIIDELQLNPPVLVPFVAAQKTTKQLAARMDQLYGTGNLKEDCGQVKIKITVEVEVNSKR